MRRDPGHRNKPAVPKDGRKLSKVIPVDKTYIREIPLGPAPAELQGKKLEEQLERIRLRDEKDKAMTSKERAAQKETNRVPAADFNDLIGFNDVDTDFSAFEDSSGRKTHFELMRACLERI